LGANKTGLRGSFKKPYTRLRDEPLSYAKPYIVERIEVRGRVKGRGAGLGRKIGGKGRV